jgi:type IV pilus assembly protein PilM
MSFLNQFAKKPLQKYSQGKLGPIGFDLAIERLNLMQMEKIANGGFKVRAAASIEYPTNRDDLIASPGDFCAFVRGALKTKPFKGKKIVSRLPDNKTKIINLSYKLPAGRDEAETIVKEVMARLGDTADNHVMDYMPIRSAVKDSPEKKVLVAVSKREDVISYLELLEKAGLDALALDIGPVALRRLVVSLDYENKYPTVLMINFARANSYLTVLSGRRLMMDEEVDFGEDKLITNLSKSLMMNREVGFGENMLVTRLSKEFQTEEDHAYKLLYKYGFGNDIGDTAVKSMTTDQHEIIETIREILKPLFLELANEVNKVLIYTASETRGGSIERIYLLGSVARYPGAAPFISDMLSIPAEVLNPLALFATSRYPDMLDDCNPIAGIALATGLALRGIYSNG